jgi:hypothetical protein
VVRSLELASGCSEARKLTGEGRGWRREGGQPITRLTRAWEATVRLGGGGEEVAAVVLMNGEGRRRAGRCVVDEGRGSPFYRGLRG